VLFVLLDTDFE